MVQTAENRACGDAMPARKLVTRDGYAAGPPFRWNPGTEGRMRPSVVVMSYPVRENTCRSLSGRTQSRHSRRAVPITRSQNALLLDSARAKLTTDSMAEIFITDTIEQVFEDWPRLQVVSVAPLIAEAIQRVTAERLVGDRV